MLTDAEQNFVGYCVRKIDDDIVDFVDNLAGVDTTLSIPDDEDQAEIYMERIYEAVYAGLVNFTPEQLNAARLAM
jgi:hypothetical protein